MTTLRLLGATALAITLSGCALQLSSPSATPPPVVVLTPTPRGAPTALPTVTLPTACSYHVAADSDPLPDPRCTPGALNPDVTQDNIRSTICKPGWTSSVRPPQRYTDPLKLKMMTAYATTQPARYVELDHLVPLELGGAPWDPANLWPEPGASPNSKDQVENMANRAVCSGRVTLDHAQQQMRANWTVLGEELHILP